MLLLAALLPATACTAQLVPISNIEPHPALLTQPAAPALPATKVCAFQEKPTAPDTVSDADALKDELTADSVPAVAADGIAPRREDAEGRKLGCTWILTVWRQKQPPNSPLYPGDETRQSVATVNAMANSQVHRDLIDYNLRRVGSRKSFAQGYSQDASPYTKIAGFIAKKLSRKK